MGVLVVALCVDMHITSHVNICVYAYMLSFAVLQHPCTFVLPVLKWKFNPQKVLNCVVCPQAQLPLSFQVHGRPLQGRVGSLRVAV